MHGILGPDDMLPGGETRVEIAFRMIRSRFPVVTKKRRSFLKQISRSWCSANRCCFRSQSLISVP
jgi:hypothetical protein